MLAYFLGSPRHLAAPSAQTGNAAAAGRSEREFNEVPAEMWVENYPASTNLLPAPRPQSLQVSPKQTTVAPSAILSGWNFRGPAPIPNGQTVGRVDPISGRVASIAVHPTDANIAYVGAASGGLYRTLDGGATWTQLMDNATAPSVGIPLSIGSVTIDPTDSTRVFVGTGEGNLSADSFFGSGFYIITGADSGSPVVNGPYNAASGADPLGGVPAGVDIFTGRSIVAIAVDPTNANNVYVSTSSGIGGIRSAAYSVLPRRGVYRSTNALSASPTWTRLQVGGTSSNTISSSLILDPQNPNNLLVAMVGQAAADPSGIYRTTNATAAAPTFTVSLPLPANTSLNSNAKLSAGFSASVNGGTTVFYTTTAENAPTASSQGKLYKSIDAGATFTNLPAVNGFAGGQGFYDISVGSDPNNPNSVSVGGQAGSRTFERSTDGGATFTIDTTGTGITVGLHADVHAIVYAKSNGSVIYHGNDGGVWRSADGGSNWTSINTAGFSAAQYESLALHPTDGNFSIGGTQDNGTHQLRPDGTFFRIDFGDGGYSLIDQNAPDTTSVVQYHTYFNQRLNLIGTGRVLNNPCATEGQWSFHGIYGGALDTTTVYCDGTMDTFNGILLTDNVQFYAPMVLGPGSPNTWYFGTDKLYRSTNLADTALAQTPFLGDFVNDIAISAQDDNVRILGTNGSDGSGAGSVWATTTGGVMVKIVGTNATNGPGVVNVATITRVAIDPNNKNIGYFSYGGFGTPASPSKHFYRINNLDALNTAGVVSVTAISNGLPDVPIDSIAIDPQSGSGTNTSTDLYVGTDIGVYRSTDAGASWSAYNSNLPRVPIFALAVQNPTRQLRAATHGRGMWDIGITASAAQPPSLLAAYSRKTHGGAGTYDVNLPLTGIPLGVECRRGTPATGSHTIVVRFTNTIVSGTATVTSGTGTAGPPTYSGTDMIVPLTGVTDVQQLTLTVSNVTDINGNTLASASIPIGFNIGDTTNDKSVNSADISQTKGNSGANVTAATFRTDVTVDGSINSADISQVKAKSGQAIP